MRRARLAALTIATLAGSATGARAEQSLSMDQAVAVALRQNRDIIAARLEIKAAEIDRVAAGLYTNPVVSYEFQNMVLGSGNGQPVGGVNQVSPGMFSQPVQTVGVAQLIDVWLKRSKRVATADRGIALRRLQIEDALREIVFQVRSAFADVSREQSEQELAHETADRYQETLRISRVRRASGDISPAELNKLELEGLRFLNAVIDADAQYDLSRQKLAGLLALPPNAIAGVTKDESRTAAAPVETLTERALQQRPDFRATRAAQQLADAELGAAKREVLPDLTFNLGYTRSNFVIAGDNPNTLALGVSLPLPVFDRNQVGLGRARLDRERADNDSIRVAVQVRREVADAARHRERAQSLVTVFEGGMLERATSALHVAESSYKNGAISLLELLEARRTYIDTRGQALRALYDLQQAEIEIRHAVGEEPAK